MRVLWVSHTGTWGGAEMCLLEAIDALSVRGVESVVVVPAREALAERLEAMGVPVHVAPYTWWVGWDRPGLAPAWRALRNLLSLPRLTALLRRLRPDLVVTNTLASPAGALAAKLAGLPHVWYIHEFGEEDHGMRFDLGRGVSLRAIRRLSDQVVVVSNAVGEKFSRWIPDGSLSVIYAGAEASAEPTPMPGEEGPFRMVMVGVKHPGKRQEDALRALAVLREQGIESELELVGQEVPEYAAFLRRLAGELGVTEAVRFVPFTPDPLAHVARAHAVLVCSTMEAFGRVTVEAMKMGRPVVGAASGGTRELVRDGWNGLLFRPHDANDLAAKVALLARDRAVLHGLGRNALEWSRSRFTPESYARELAALFERVLAPTRGAAGLGASLCRAPSSGSEAGSTSR